MSENDQTYFDRLVDLDALEAFSKSTSVRRTGSTLIDTQEGIPTKRCSLRGVIETS